MAGQANDTEKLPWLEPYREPAAKRARNAPKKAKLKAVPAPETPVKAAKAEPASTPPVRKGAPLAAWLSTGIAVVAAAVGVGYVVGKADTPPVSTAPTVTIPVAKVDPIPMPDVLTPEPRAETAAPVRAARPAPKRATPVRRKVAERAPPRPAAAPPMPKVMAIRFSPPPSAARPGMVVDLGRYLSPNLADRAYRTTVGRYPYLSRLTKVVAPQPPVYGQPRLYALQLGARTPAEARSLCNNLKSIGRPCVVR